jgi:hypothetical protein
MRDAAVATARDLDAGAGVVDGAPDVARTWAEVPPRFVQGIFVAQERFKVFAVGRDVLVARLQGDQFRVARLDGDVLVDEPSWSLGLPPRQKCNRIGAIFGRLPNRIWLVENAGGSMACSSTFGEYAVWHRANGTWLKDVAHSPPPGRMVGGELATWPLSDRVIGVGVSNLVGDTLTQPVDAMWTSAPDPWATRVHIAQEGAWVQSACASSSDVLAVVSMSEEPPRRGTLTIIQPGKARQVVNAPPADAPWGPCAVSEAQVLIVQPPGDGAARETWISFDAKARTWTPIVIPWPYRTRRIQFTSTHVVALAQDAEGNDHLLVTQRNASSWTDLVGLNAREIEIVPITTTELLLHLDGTKLTRIGL